MSEFDVKQGLQVVQNKIKEACERRNFELQCVTPRLVAASKTKPVSNIIEAYEAGQRHFGENYVQEMEEKAKNPELLEKCKEIKWHFIGHLQSNKVNKILSLPNIYMIETVHSQKLADILNRSWPNFSTTNSKLNVYIQVNTSGEQEKSGVKPEETYDLAKYILEECDNLYLDGLMTIGQYGYNPADGPNPDFIRLKNCRDELCDKLNLDWKKMNMSMGMSTDYELAIEMGSTNVRVGTAIFGFRTKMSV